MVLVRNYLDLSRAEILKLIKVCEFIVFIYMETWFTAPLAISAPNNDMQFFKKLKKWETIDSSISKATVHKLKGHFWYISLELWALSFFDEKVSWDTKINMVLALQKAPL